MESLRQLCLPFGKLQDKEKKKCSAKSRCSIKTSWPHLVYPEKRGQKKRKEWLKGEQSEVGKKRISNLELTEKRSLACATRTKIVLTHGRRLNTGASVPTPIGADDTSPCDEEEGPRPVQSGWLRVRAQ